MHTRFSDVSLNFIFFNEKTFSFQQIAGNYTAVCNNRCVQIAHSTNGPPFDSFDVWFESLQRHSTCCRLLITFLDSIVVSIPAVRCKGSRAASKKLVANVGQVFKWLFNEIPVLYWMGVPPIQCRVPEIGGRIEFEASEPPLESRPLLFMVDRRWMLLLPTAIQNLKQLDDCSIFF